MGRSRKFKGRAVGRGSILLISSLLIGSAVLRIAMGAGTALAETDFDGELARPDMPSEPDIPSEKVDYARVTTLLDALREREERVAGREAQLDVRRKALDVAQIEIERRLDALELAEKRLSATLSLAETAAEDDLVRLTSVYENMKPKDATALFGAMEPDFAAGFLARMRPDVSAKIMAGLDPQLAYSISAILAGRNAKAPKS